MAKSAVLRAVSRFKQLSCLGLDPDAAMPALLAELHGIVPSYASTFYFTDAGGHTSHIYMENTEYYPLLPFYWEAVHERAELPGDAWSLAATIFGAHTREERTDIALAARSPAHLLTERVVGYDPNYLRMIVHEAGRMVGGVRLWRSLGKAIWTAAEMRRLEELEPFFGQALSRRVEGDAPLIESSLGLIVADVTGKPLYSTREGTRLLFLAQHPRNGPDVDFEPAQRLPTQLHKLCVDLDAIFAGDPNTPAPVYCCRNVMGSFSFRAQWLEGASGSGLVAITITHREPRSIRLVRAISELGLTRRQAEVCLLMAEGLAIDTIAERLGISPHTANEHGRWVYNRLDVHSRAELAGKLL
jgi:DNA-binding CsgD family transcriptional regulator